MKIAIFAYTKQGGETALKTGNILKKTDEVRIYAPDKYIQDGIQGFPEESDFYEKMFHESNALIFVSAAGIALRKIAPYIKSKVSDPAVIVIDERGRFVIPVLSGHLGGANSLSLFIARAMSAQPVITTATDINKVFSVDTWASKNGFCLHNIHMVKYVSGRLIHGEKVGLYSDFPIDGRLPDNITAEEKMKYGINITYHKNELFTGNLYIVPKGLSIGLGCRKDTSFLSIEHLFLKTIENNQIFMESIENIASIDLKEGEAGLLRLSEKYSIPLKFYSAKELNGVQGNFNKSDFVKRITGTDNVCERAAVLASQSGKIVIPKISENGVTIAAALKEIPIDFNWERTV